MEAEEAFVEAHKIHAELIQKKRAEKNRIFIAVYACRRPNGFNGIVQLLAQELIELYRDKHAQ